MPLLHHTMSYPQVAEIIHYFHGLAQIYLPTRVVFGVNMSEDVLFNEVPVFMFLAYASYSFNISILTIIIGNGNLADEKV